MNERKNLLAAMLKAQAALPNVSKDAENPHFGKKYATLDGIWETVRKPLAEAGLVVTNSIADGVVTTTIADVKSGESIASSFPLPQGVNPQGIGSALTYARRYNLCALLQITTGDDDDGNAASGADGKQKPQNPPAKPSETAKKVEPLGPDRSPFKQHGFKPWADMETSQLEKMMAYKHERMTPAHYQAIAAELGKRKEVELKNQPKI